MECTVIVHGELHRVSGCYSRSRSADAVSALDCLDSSYSLVDYSVEAHGMSVS